MRRLALALACCGSLAQAATEIDVEPNHLLRLAGAEGVVILRRLDVADHASLLIPAGVRELQVDELRLGKGAYIGIAPGEDAFRLEVQRGEIGPGSRIDAHGLAGTPRRHAGGGRALMLKLYQVEVADLVVDLRGGQGAPGYAGLDGAYGEPGGCLWGRAGRGDDGQNGGDGQAGGAGGRLRLEVPSRFPVDRLSAQVDGGAGGAAGQGGQPGKGGTGKGCWIYGTAPGHDGRPGVAGRPGLPGMPGSVDVVRF